MTRGELIRALRSRGVAARPHHVRDAVANFRLDPPPKKDGSGRLIYVWAHVHQLAARLSTARATTSGPSAG